MTEKMENKEQILIGILCIEMLILGILIGKVFLGEEVTRVDTYGIPVINEVVKIVPVSADDTTKDTIGRFIDEQVSWIYQDFARDDYEWCVRLKMKSNTECAQETANKYVGK